MARHVLRMLNLGQSGNPDSYAVDTPPGGIGQNGGIYEDNSQNSWQMFQLVDAGGVAGDIAYIKSYSGQYLATPTIGNSSAAEVAGVVTTTVTANQYTLLRQGGTFPVKANGIFSRGVAVGADSGNNRAVPFGVTAKVALTALDTAGGILAWQNPYTDDIFVTRLIVDTTTKSTGASTADFGIAANGTTSNDTLIDGVDLGTAAGAFDNYVNHGTDGLSMVRLSAGSYVTGSKASGAAAGLVGSAYISFMRSAAPAASTIGIAQGALSTGKVSTFLTIQNY